MGQSPPSLLFMWDEVPDGFLLCDQKNNNIVPLFYTRPGISGPQHTIASSVFPLINYSRSRRQSWDAAGMGDLFLALPSLHLKVLT